ncbi:hypothetical protein Tco_0678247 [Tanacetum coccineum]|uniref:Uncharacterized protein n=1 Tax=Tanacetum coccineum TaxID=301880 RepID=A0ABQ4XFD6_9ASTR
MANYKHSQLKNKSFEEIQMLFDNTMKWVDSFVPMYTKVMEGSKSQAEESKERIREGLESDNSKKQKIDENVEAEVDDEAEMKKLMEIVPDDEVAIDAIPLATKSPIIVDWKIIKEGNMGYFQIIRADRSSRRPYEAYERVLWGDLKWSTFCEISESTYLYAGREKVSTNTCNNYKNAQQEASN